ncbi:MAG: hypothetical protein F4Y02_08920 [Chloroflexi bacterium]|nr:hypothetical protein [Chloroflexota bacterium]
MTENGKPATENTRKQAVRRLTYTYGGLFAVAGVASAATYRLMATGVTMPPGTTTALAAIIILLVTGGGYTYLTGQPRLYNFISVSIAAGGAVTLAIIAFATRHG